MNKRIRKKWRQHGRIQSSKRRTRADLRLFRKHHPNYVSEDSLSYSLTAISWRYVRDWRNDHPLIDRIFPTV